MEVTDLGLAEDLKTAVRLGTLTSGPVDPQTSRDVVLLLREATGADAVLLVGHHAARAAHHPVAAFGYPAAVAWHAVNTFPRTGWFDTVLAHPLPSVISLRTEVDFRDGDYYRHHVAPGGFRDGASMALRHAGRYVGMLHLSSRQEGGFSGRHQQLLAGLGDGLGRLVAPQRQAGDVPLRIHDPALHEVLDQVAQLAPWPLTITWPGTRQWLRLHLRPRRSGDGAHPSGSDDLAVQVVARTRPHGLTRRELEVLTALTTGASNELIAADLVISPRTVHTHVEHILAKLGAANRTQAACVGVREGLMWPSPDPERLTGVPGVLGAVRPDGQADRGPAPR